MGCVKATTKLITMQQTINTLTKLEPDWCHLNIWLAVHFAPVDVVVIIVAVVIIEVVVDDAGDNTSDFVGCPNFF